MTSMPTVRLCLVCSTMTANRDPSCQSMPVWNRFGAGPCLPLTEFYAESRSPMGGSGWIVRSDGRSPILPVEP